MENIEINKLANTFSNSVMRGKGIEAVDLLKNFVNMDVGITLKVVEKDQNKDYDINEPDYQAPPTSQEILDYLLARGYDREKSEISAVCSDSLENAIKYYQSLQ